MTKNGDFTFLVLDLILADQVADLPPNTRSQINPDEVFYVKDLLPMRVTI